MKQETIKKVLALVQSNYEDIADEFNLSRKKIAWPFLHTYCKKISSGEVILDVACGNGRLCHEFNNKKISYLGIDNSKGLIKLARQNYPDYQFEQANFLEDKFLKKIESKHQSFDKIFFLAAFQHVPSKYLRLEVLKNIKYYLKPGGELIISNWNIWRSQHRHKIIKSAWGKIIGKNNLDFKDIIFPWQGQKNSDRYYHAFTKRELINLVKQADLSMVSYYNDHHNYWLIVKISAN